MPDLCSYPFFPSAKKTRLKPNSLSDCQSGLSETSNQDPYPKCFPIRIRTHNAFQSGSVHKTLSNQESVPKNAVQSGSVHKTLSHQDPFVPKMLSHQDLYTKRFPIRIRTQNAFQLGSAPKTLCNQNQYPVRKTLSIRDPFPKRCPVRIHYTKRFPIRVRTHQTGYGSETIFRALTKSTACRIFFKKGQDILSKNV